MTEIKTYPYIKYIPHWFVLRLVVCAPFGIAWYICNFLAEKLEKFGDVLDDVLPQAYVEKHVEWDQLPKHRQEAIEKLAKARDTTKERILFQTVKP